MLILVFGHLLIVHILNNVDDITYQFVATRWQSLGWRFYDWLLLAESGQWRVRRPEFRSPPGTHEVRPCGEEHSILS